MGSPSPCDSGAKDASGNLSLRLHKGDPKTTRAPGLPLLASLGQAGRQGALQRAGPTTPQSTVWEAAGRSTEGSVDAHTGAAGATPSAPRPTAFPDHDPRQSGAEAPVSLFPPEVQDPECLPPSRGISEQAFLFTALKEASCLPAESISEPPFTPPVPPPLTEQDIYFHRCSWGRANFFQRRQLT